MGTSAESIRHSAYTSDVALANSVIDEDNANPYVINGCRTEVVHSRYRLDCYKGLRLEEFKHQRVIQTAPWSVVHPQTRADDIERFNRARDDMIWEGEATGLDDLNHKYSTYELNSIANVMELGAREGGSRERAYVGKDLVNYGAFLDTARSYARNIRTRKREFTDLTDAPFKLTSGSVNSPTSPMPRSN